MKYLKPLRKVRSFLRRVRLASGEERVVEVHCDRSVDPPCTEEQHYAEIASAVEEELLARFEGRS